MKEVIISVFDSLIYYEVLVAYTFYTIIDLNVLLTMSLYFVRLHSLKIQSSSTDLNNGTYITDLEKEKHGKLFCVSSQTLVE